MDLSGILGHRPGEGYFPLTLGLALAYLSAAYCLASGASSIAVRRNDNEAFCFMIWFRSVSINASASAAWYRVVTTQLTPLDVCWLCGRPCPKSSRASLNERQP